MDAASLIGRILLSALFIAAGLHKIIDYSESVAFMARYNVPAILLPPTIAFQVVLGVAVLVGFATRPSALLLAGYCVLTAAIFHSNFAEPIQIAMFMKNLAIAGGLAMLYANGPGRFAIRG